MRGSKVEHFNFSQRPTEAQRIKMQVALDYLQTSEIARMMLDKIVGSSSTIVLNSEGRAQYNPFKGLIGYDKNLPFTDCVYWDPSIALGVANNREIVQGVRSSAVVFIHEIAHALEPAGFAMDPSRNLTVEQLRAGLRFEGFAIDKENAVALELGESFRRTNYFGQKISVTYMTDHTIADVGGTQRWNMLPFGGQVSVFSSSFTPGALVVAETIIPGGGTATEMSPNILTVSNGRVRIQSGFDLRLNGDSDRITLTSRARVVTSGRNITISSGFEEVNLNGAASSTYLRGRLYVKADSPATEISVAINSTVYLSGSIGKLTLSEGSKAILDRASIVETIFCNGQEVTLGRGQITLSCTGGKITQIGDASGSEITGSKVTALGGDSVLTANGTFNELRSRDGNDRLIGSALGRTRFAGGLGTDKYELAAGRRDTEIIDTDGKGEILISGVAVTGGKKVDESNWQGDGWKYHKTSGDSLIATRASTGDSFVIRDFDRNGGDHLGIVLEETPIDPIVTTPATTINGDLIYATVAARSPRYRNVNGVSQVVADIGDTIYVRGVNGNLAEDPNGETITNNVLFGGAGSDALNGLSGNDLLNGAGGDDQLDGGTGDDMIAGGDGSDTIKGGDGNDYINSSASVSGAGLQQIGPNDQWINWGLPAGVTAITSGSTWGTYLDTSDPEFTVTKWSGLGAASSDANQQDIIDGGAGDDSIVASWGADQIKGGSADTLFGGKGNDRIAGDAGDIKKVANDDCFAQVFLKTRLAA